MSVFDKLDDETPPSSGQEIGAAVSAALAEVAKESQRATEAMTVAIENALKSVDRPTSSAPVIRWVFDVEHNEQSRVVRIIATAER